MNDLLTSATKDLAHFLGEHLPTISPDWWEKHVEERLTFQQQRMVGDRGITSLRELDFAALLRVLDQNWYELTQTLNLPREARTWVKELQTIRNKWAHMGAVSIANSELYRDADTLGRFLQVLSAEAETMASVEAVKTNALENMVAERGIASTVTSADLHSVEPQHSDPVTASVGGTSRPQTLFEVGDLVALRSDRALIMPVLEVVPGGVECRYRVFQNNKKVTYFESQLQHPEDIDEAGKRLGAEEFRAYLTSLQLLSPSTANLYSLRLGRVEFVPYQYRPVLKLIRSDRPRLLVADEVGVGKTIEAGLIVKELRARMDISSVLIICPKALVSERKWFLEMKRFDEQFIAVDGKLLRHCLLETHLDGEWPSQYAKAIVPFSLFDSDLLFGTDKIARRKAPGLLSLDPPPKFDLVIVDEAHHIRNESTYLHQAVRYFCDNAQAAIFLTATPVQLGSEDLYTLLNVLRPDLIIDKPSFQQMAEPNRSINEAVQLCRSAKPGWSIEARACLDEAAGTSWGRLFLRETPGFQTAYDQLAEERIDDESRVGIVRTLEDLYTFSPLINRTRRRDIGEFTTRKPETVSVPFTPGQQALHDELLDVVARILAFAHGVQNVKFMMTTIRRQAASCLFGLAPLLRDMLTAKLDDLEIMEASDQDVEVDLGFLAGVRTDIDDLLAAADNLDSHDPKVEAFLKVLDDKSKLQNNKALVFSTFRHTLAYLAEHATNAGIRFGLVHGGINDEERSDVRSRFALPKESPDALDVLLSSEVGCEGLDFQFCDLLINYDLPWNPMRVEQRIGRIDRYGQKSDAIAIVNLITPGTVDADIYERCLWRIGVFQHAVGGSEEILGEITRAIHDIAENLTLTTEERANRLQQLSDNRILQIQEELALEETQAELFGLSVPKHSWRQDIEAAENLWLSPIALQRCVELYLAHHVGTATDMLRGDKPLKSLRLNQEARIKLLDAHKGQPRTTDPVARQWEKWLKGSEPILSVTFDQETAASVPSATYLNVLHPLVRQAAHHLSLTDAVQTNLMVHGDGIEPGQYPFALHLWRKAGIKADDTIVVVSTDPTLERQLMDLLATATDLPERDMTASLDMHALDERHHALWSSARADHMAENRQLIEHRRHSLDVSHQARCALLEDQLARVQDDKIRRMKESELARAIQDYERRVLDLENADGSADLHTTAIAFGTVTVMGASR